MSIFEQEWDTAERALDEIQASIEWCKYSWHDEMGISAQEGLAFVRALVEHAYAQGLALPPTDQLLSDIASKMRAFFDFLDDSPVGRAFRDWLRDRGAAA